MKNLRILLISLTVLFISLPVIVFDSAIAQASDVLQLVVTPSKASAKVGDDVTFTISMSSAVGLNFGAFSFDIVCPEGMTYKTGSGAINPNFKSETGLATVNFETDSLGVTGYGAVVGGYNGAGLDIATFVCSVTATGTRTVTLANVDCRNTSFPPAVIETAVAPAVVSVGVNVEDEPPVFEHNTWQLPAVCTADILLPLDGWEVRNLFLNIDSSFLQLEGADIIVSGNAPPFRGIAKLSNNGIIRYIGIEKLAKASVGTTFDGKTWTIPRDFTGKAIIEFDDWTIASVFSSEAEGTITAMNTSISVEAETAAFNAIVKMKNASEKVKYIGIERK